MSSPSLSTVITHFEEGVLEIVLSRPSNLNAMNGQMADDLNAVLRYAHSREDLRAVLLRGDGRAFCVGYDVDSQMPDMSAQAMHELDGFVAFFDDLEDLDVPKIVAVHGHCIGAGVVLSTLGDLVFAADDASFRLPELDFGVPFSMGGMPRLARVVGVPLVADMVLTTRTVTVDEMVSAGLVSRVTSLEELVEQAREAARAIARRPRLLLRVTTAALRETREGLLTSRGPDLYPLMLAQQDIESREAAELYVQTLGRR